MAFALLLPCRMSFALLARNFVITLGFTIAVAGLSTGDSVSHGSVPALNASADFAVSARPGWETVRLFGTELTPVPEPAALLLTGSAALIVASRMRRRRPQ